MSGEGDQCFIKLGTVGSMRINEDDFSHNRAVYLSYTALCYIAQISLSIMACVYLNQATDEIDPGSVQLTMSRFICVSLLHMFMFDECRQGLKIMKFALNHP